MPSLPVAIRRLSAVGLVALLLGSLFAAAPVAAATPHAGARNGAVTVRGHVDARAAARAATGVVRRRHELRLKSPVADRLRPLRSRPSATGQPSLRTPGADLPVSVSEFDGIDAVHEGLNLEPPDPWIAASGSYLVQSTNGLVRMTNRAGQLLAAVPTWALFSLGTTELDSDPRIEWDAAHGRWVGVLLSWIEDPDQTVIVAFLNLAISDGADPTAGWTVTSYTYWTDSSETEATLPDYPGLATSSDKIVLTANEFNSTLDAFLGASLLVVRWSDVLAGLPPKPVLWTSPDPGLAVIRPGRVQGTAADIHLVAENATLANAGHIMYARIAGSSLAAPGWTDLTTANGLDPLCDVVAPRQPGSPSTIADAVDERITDAVWRANVLAFVSTCSSLDGADVVRVNQLSTATAAPSNIDESVFGNGDADDFMGGIGFSGDGTLFLTYTESSTTIYPTTIAHAWNGAWSQRITVRDGTTGYIGSRWGDYIGVAPDPAGTAAAWMVNQVAGPDGIWTTRVGRLVLDLVAPTVTGAPNQALVSNTTLGSFTVPVKVTWASKDPGSGVVSNHLQVDRFGAGLVPAGATPGSSITRAHWWKANGDATNVSYRYGVQAEDAYGTTSGLVTGSALSAVVYQTSSGVTYTGTWKTTSSSAYSGGSTRYSSTVGSSASFKTSGRSFAVVSTRASTRGKVKVYVDGVSKGTITLTSSTSAFRRLVYVTSYATSGTHTIKLVVAKGRVDLDAFVVLR